MHLKFPQTSFRISDLVRQLIKFILTAILFVSNWKFFANIIFLIPILILFLFIFISHKWGWLLFLRAPHPKDSSFCRKICDSAAVWKAQLIAIWCQAGEYQLCSRYMASLSLSKPLHSHQCFLSRVLTLYATSILPSPGEHSRRLSKRNSWEAASDRVSISHLRTLVPTSFLLLLTGYVELC